MVLTSAPEPYADAQVHPKPNAGACDGMSTALTFRLTTATACWLLIRKSVYHCSLDWFVLQVAQIGAAYRLTKDDVQVNLGQQAARLQNLKELQLCYMQQDLDKARRSASQLQVPSNQTNQSNSVTQGLHHTYDFFTSCCSTVAASVGPRASSRLLHHRRIMLNYFL